MAVRKGVVWHGGFLNIQPALELQRRVKAAPVAAGPGPHTMGSLEADVQRRVRMPEARAAVVEHIVDAFGFPGSHIQSGFPVPLRESGRGTSERRSRVG